MMNNWHLAMKWLKITAFLALLLTLQSCTLRGDAPSDELPNILWITSEDNSPFLGAYGDEYADTPNLDRLAERGVLYENAYATTPVCAPARFTLITGTYANRMGTENMRSTFPIPDEIQFYPHYLQEAGYHTTNNQKKDYNTVDQPEVWDESSGEAHYSDREEGQPFLHVRNLTVSHESSLHDPIDTLRHDPAEAPVPPYHPETEAVRTDWAHYYDEVTRMDEQVGEVLEELEESGEAENTIVFYYGDHGGAVPGSKRFMNEPGLHVPLIVYFPPRYEHLAPEEKRTDRLVSFVDFPATLLSLAGIEPPEFMDGEPFLGEYETKPREYVHTNRGRMDERYDLSRAVRDEEYLYVRNYMPQRVYGQHLSYLWQAPSMQSWEEEFEKGTLNGTQRRFFEPKPPEELYRISDDPHTVNNLAGDPAYKGDLQRLREVSSAWTREVTDLGFIPEGLVDSLRGDRALYEAARQDEFPISEIIETAEMASMDEEGQLEELAARLDHADPSVRFWAAMGMAIAGEAASTYEVQLAERADDPAGPVRVAVAEALLALDRSTLAIEIIDWSLTHPEDYVKLRALNLLEAEQPEAIPEATLGRIRQLEEEYEDAEGAGNYVYRASARLAEESAER